MDAIEYAAWESHIDHFPPGDFYGQQLLAMILCAILDMWKKQGEARTDIYDVAPWLEEPLKRLERFKKSKAKQEQKDKAARAERARRVTERYHRTKWLEATAQERYGKDFHELPLDQQAALSEERQQQEEAEETNG